MLEYPRQMYHKDGRSQPVLNADQETELDGEWSREPSEAHRLMRSGDSAAAVMPVHQSGGDDIVEKIITRMREEFFSESADPAAPIKRGPGRPPKASTTPVSADRGGASNVEPVKD